MKKVLHCMNDRPTDKKNTEIEKMTEVTDG